MPTYILPFASTDLRHVPLVGGKNASLGEMFQKLTTQGIRVPDGFSVTAQAYQDFIKANGLEAPIKERLSKLDTQGFSNLQETGAAIRQLFSVASIPDHMAQEILRAYRTLCNSSNHPIQVAVRSSATAEDLPEASFAGQHESFLNISGEQQLLATCLRCYTSLFTDRAIKYRHDHGFDHLKVYLSIGVQRMVRSDKASAGVCFTLDPESGNTNVILVTGSWGLGENVVQGAVNTDDFYVFKEALAQRSRPVIAKKMGSKTMTMVYAENKADSGNTIVNTETPEKLRKQFILNDQEITTIASWALTIEKHYGRPMDIEWAKDGLTNELHIVQARPETIHANRKKALKLTRYTLKDKGTVLAEGKGIGNRIVSGKARLLTSPAESNQLQEGEILVTEITNPDWDPVLKKASAIVTNRGGRTSHAAIVAREMGALAVVGTGNATTSIQDGEEVTVVSEDGINGLVYRGKLSWTEEDFDLSHLQLPQTEAKFILANPDQAFTLSMYPNHGIGLLRMEFIVTSSIKIHPMALAKFEQVASAQDRKTIEELTASYPTKQEYFIDKLSQAIGTIAAAFYPKEVIVRMSDFKSNEYANLIGGQHFEPKEENPMIGFRGASRYYHPSYQPGFALECEAMKRVREEMGLSNVKLMIPFCRTEEEGQRVLDTLKASGLERGKNGLEIYMMTEIPSNVILAKEFAKLFDGFSIGSNDLTQLTLGLDRDSSIVSELFNEQNEAVKRMIAMVIRSARETQTPIGLCGQAPSDYPEFTEFLIEQGISSISFNPDALLNGIRYMQAAESKKKGS